MMGLGEFGTSQTNGHGNGLNAIAHFVYSSLTLTLTPKPKAQA